jgi:hypothetical protein
VTYITCFLTALLWNHLPFPPLLLLMDVCIHLHIVHVHNPSINISRAQVAPSLMAVKMLDLVVLMFFFFLKPFLLRTSLVLRIIPFSRYPSVRFLGLSKHKMDLLLVFFINTLIKELARLFTLSPRSQQWHFCTIVNYTPCCFGGKQHLETLDGYIIPLSICSCLRYMDMCSPTLDTYPHVFFPTESMTSILLLTWTLPLMIYRIQTTILAVLMCMVTLFCKPSK